MKKLKSIFCGGSLLYLTLYLPIVLMTYFPHWYILNCKLHPRCKFIGYSNALKYIDELTDFFLHRSTLPTGWTVKERLHLGEVRDILDALAIIAVIFIIILIAVFDRSKIPVFALVNLVIILSLLLLLPFFKTFWAEIFHPLFFNNDFWKNNPYDHSFYIMPGVFFRHSMILFIGASAIINGLIWLVFRKYRKKLGPFTNDDSTAGTEG